MDQADSVHSTPPTNTSANNIVGLPPRLPGQRRCGGRWRRYSWGGSSRYLNWKTFFRESLTHPSR